MPNPSCRTLFFFRFTSMTGGLRCRRYLMASWLIFAHRLRHSQHWVPWWLSQTVREIWPNLAYLCMWRFSTPHLLFAEQDLFSSIAGGLVTMYYFGSCSRTGRVSDLQSTHKHVPDLISTGTGEIRKAWDPDSQELLLWTLNSKYSVHLGGAANMKW